MKDKRSKNEIDEIFKRSDYNKQEDLKYALNEYYCSRIYYESLLDYQSFSRDQMLPDGIDLLIERCKTIELWNIKYYYLKNS